VGVVNGKDLTSVGVNDGDKVGGVGVEVVVGAETGEAEALLEAATGETLINGDTPAVNVEGLLVNANGITGNLDLGVGAADVLDPEELLGLERGVDVLAEEYPADDNSLLDLSLTLEVGGEVNDRFESLLRVVADDVNLERCQCDWSWWSVITS
jgi:hypothetical protein